MGDRVALTAGVAWWRANRRLTRSFDVASNCSKFWNMSMPAFTRQPAPLGGGVRRRMGVVDAVVIGKNEFIECFTSR